MTRHDFGFALTLALLLLAPGIPFGAGFVSVAGFGFVLWFLLSADLPLLRFLRVPSLLGLIGFAIYALLVSMANAKPGAIVYAVQFGGYVLLASMLLPAYLSDEGRRRNAWRIVAVIGGVYCIGLMVSIWSGPIYPWQANGWHKAYGDLQIARAMGFGESAGVAGGIAAVFACFAFFVYRRRERLVLPLIVLTLASLLATGTRSAIAAFLAAVIMLAILGAVRPLLGSPVTRRAMTMRAGTIVLCAAVPLVIIAATPAFYSMTPAVERLVLDDHHRTNDIAMRLSTWQEGLNKWAARDEIAVQMFGAGFRSGGITARRGVYDTSHNAYIEALLDFGVVGLLLFGSFLLVTMVRFAGGLMRRPGQRMLAFAFTGLAVLVVHNGGQVFFWTPEVAVLMVLLLACGELALGEQPQHIIADRHPRLAPINGIAATAGDLIRGNPHAVTGWREAVRSNRRMRAT